MPRHYAKNPDILPTNYGMAVTVIHGARMVSVSTTIGGFLSQRIEQGCYGLTVYNRLRGLFRIVFLVERPTAAWIEFQNIDCLHIAIIHDFRSQIVYEGRPHRLSFSEIWRHPHSHRDKHDGKKNCRARPFVHIDFHIKTQQRMLQTSH